MLKSIRILLSIMAHLDYEIWQMDVKTAFLNGHFEEDIYMMQSDGFVEKPRAKSLQTAEIHLWIKASIPKLEHPF